MTKKRGFSLLELSIVLSISSILMYSAVKLFTSLAQNAMTQNNSVKMKQVQVAIEAFFAKNNRLPCPADPTMTYTNSSYGKEMFTGNECFYKLSSYLGSSGTITAGFRNQILSVYSTDTNDANVNHYIMFGTIPFKDLGLNESDMHDAYGNKLSYIVPAGYAAKRSAATTGIYAKIKGWTRVALPAKLYNSTKSCTYTNVSLPTGMNSSNTNICLEKMPPVCPSASDSSPIIITTLALDKSSFSSPNVIAGDAIVTPCKMNLKDYSGNYISRDNMAYFLISHGKNGYGAWNKGGTINSYTTASPQEQQNSFAYYQQTYTSYDLMGSLSDQINITGSSVASDFDDEVIYDTIDKLLAKTGMSKNVYCHQSTTYLDIPQANLSTKCAYWAMTMNSSSIEKTGNITAPSDGTTCPASSVANYLSCGSGGIWVNPTP